MAPNLLRNVAEKKEKISAILAENRELTRIIAASLRTAKSGLDSNQLHFAICKPPFPIFPYLSATPRPCGGASASFSKKFGNVFLTHSGFRIRIPGTTNPSIEKHMAIRWSS
jgi:hypothetical protein